MTDDADCKQSEMTIILHIDTERTWRGGEAQLFSLCRGLAARGFRQCVVTQPDAPLCRHLKEIGIEIIEMPMRGEFDLRATFRLARIIRARHIDLVHAHDAHSHALAWLATMGSARVPVVVTRRVDFPVGGNPLSLLKYKSRRIMFITISSGVKKALLDGGVPEDRIEVVPSGIEPDKFTGAGDGSAFRKKFSLTDKHIVIGNIAALTDHKGQIYLIEAAARVLGKIPNVRFFILGEGELRPLLQRRIERLGLRGKVILTGFRKDVADALAAMDLFVLSSHLEGLCTSLLDAMLMRVPVVATRAGGIPDVVRDGENGLLVEPKNPEALAEAIIRLLKDNKLRDRCKDTGYESVLQHFTTDKMVAGTATVYGKLI